MINTLCNGLNPSQASLWLSLCMDTWDKFGPFTVDPLDRACTAKPEERKVPSYCSSCGQGSKKDGEEGWIWKGTEGSRESCGAGAEVC